MHRPSTSNENEHESEFDPPPPIVEFGDADEDICGSASQTGKFISRID